MSIISSPASFPLRWPAEADFNQSFTFFQSDGVTPQNITGWTFALDFYDTPGGTLLYSIGPSSMTNGGATGVLAISVLQATVAAALGAAYAGYYVLIENDGGQSTPWFHGIANMELA